MAKIKIIGTSHVSPESVAEIEKTIKENAPDCVAVELDRGRFEGLLHKQEPTTLKAISQFGIRTFIFVKIFSAIQKHLGKKTGVFPGEEMLTAVRAAKDAGVDVALIDQDIRITLEKMKNISFLEKAKLFLSLFKKTSIDEKIDLRKVPLERVVESVLTELKRTAPNFHRVLVEERDFYMAKALVELSKKYENIVAVVGVGHKKGIAKYLKALK